MRGMLIDTTLCVGCYACEEADARRWGANAGEKHELSATLRTAVLDGNGVNVPRMCMHCGDPTCVSVCPVGALKKASDGPVVYEADRCMGCRYCMQACPFNVPKYEWESLNPKIIKCDLCVERVSEGKVPACVEACAIGARMHGTLEECAREARRRIHSEPGKYVDRIYGIREAGGTSLLYISDKPFESLGFGMTIPNHPLPDLTAVVLKKIPTYVGWSGTLLAGVWWITKRRADVATGEKGEGK